VSKPECLEILKEGTKVWNKWRKDNSGIEPNLEGAILQEVELFGANLRKANLRKANLRGAKLVRADLSRANLEGAKLFGAKLRVANLREANLRGAELMGADLSFAKLIEAKLEGANLEGVYLEGAYLEGANLEGANLNGAKLMEANLKGANLVGASLKEANLINSNLSGSDFSGANITATNLHGWKIDGIRCTHVTWKNKIIYYENPDDFEKAFTNIENVVEILLDLPFSELSHITGRAIEQSINKKYGENSLFFKGQTAISNDKTKFEFLCLSEPDELTKINEKLLILQNELKPVIEEAKSKSKPRNPIGIKDEVDWQDIVTLKFPVLRPKEMERVLKERYVQIHPLLKNIINTIQLHIR
jgi:uncharacterized protein YjbI with pentapeptide repeats